jgi:carbon monoxide dehydrogenase subunit G
MIFREVIEVRARPRDVQAFVSDLKNLPEWDPTAIGVEQTSPGPVRKGTTYRVVLRFVGAQTVTDYTVTEHRPGTKTVLVGVGRRATATHTMRVERTIRGSRLTWESEIRFTGVAKLFEPVAGLLFSPNVRQAAGNLESALNALEKPRPSSTPRRRHRRVADRSRR